MSKEFAQKLKELRKNAGMTQEDLSKVLGVGRSTISEYERGVIEPKRKTLTTLSACFNVPIEYFFDKCEPNEKNIVKDIELSIQDIIFDLEYSQIPNTYDNKKLSENDEKIIAEMLKSVMRVAKLL